MKITFACPQCDAVNRTAVDEKTETLACYQCDSTIKVPAKAVTSDEIHRCIVCPSLELYVRKDFPQWLGVTIVTVGIGLSCVAWYNHWVIWTFVILLGSALIDVILFMLVGNQLKCYRCGAEYRDVAGLDTHEAFNLETHEKHRQQVARLAESEPVKPSS